MKSSKKTAEGHKLKDDVSNYDDKAYRSPSVTVDVIICSIIDDDLKVLLIKRKYPPYKDFLAIPGGFVNVDIKETLNETAHRELSEETGLENIYLEQLKTYGDPDRDPRKRIITVAFFALVPFDQISHQKIQAKDDAKETGWYSLRNLPEKLAFDHGIILDDTLTRLKGKISYSPIGFSLVPTRFTWAQLQHVYEVVLGQKLVASNFRRRIKELYDIVPLSNRRKTTIPGRPPVYLFYRGEKK